MALIDVEVEFLVSWFCFHNCSKFQGKCGTSLTASMLSYYRTLSFCILCYTSPNTFGIYVSVCSCRMALVSVGSQLHMYACVWQLKNNLHCYSLEALNRIVS